MVWALAMGRPWVPAHEDEHVAAAVSTALRDEAAVTGHDLAAGPDGALLIELALAPGLAGDDLQHLVTRIGERIAADGETRARIEALAFRVTTA